VVVSTHTIHLGEQLVRKDLPLLRAALPHEFTVVLGMGRSSRQGRQSQGPGHHRQTPKAQGLPLLDARQKVRSNQRVQLSVQHLVGVGGLIAAAIVFDQLVGV